MASIKSPERPGEPWAVEAQRFQRKLAQLLERYEGQFVALYRQR